jgi:hypothetical protein
MSEKVLSRLDTDISTILNSDISDEMKAKSYTSALARFKHISSPPKPKPAAPPDTATAAVSAVPTIPFKSVSPQKRPHKRVKIETDPSVETSLWRRTQRTSIKKQFSPQWVSYQETPRKRKKSKKSVQSWIEA